MNTFRLIEGKNVIIIFMYHNCKLVKIMTVNKKKDGELNV